MKTSVHWRLLLVLASVAALLAAVLRIDGTEAAATSEPSPWYIYDGADIQYFAPGPEFKLSRESAALKAYQADLAAQIGVSRLWVNQVERGKPGASLGLILRALAAVGVEISGDVSGEAGGKRPYDGVPVISPDINAIVAGARRKDRP